ncbi:AAA family ATPase [Streptomyces sp. NPDC047939]|uniref:AAA family ATPase n=1 Tax=Streptomyces sp. NPDC047939 TaxID=3155381 RepID=UPI00341C7E2F
MLYVVTGPPGAGKSSYIQAHAKPVDIVIDLDLMALAMAGPGADHHDHSDILLAITHRARYAAIREAEQHLDRVDVYLIQTLPSAKQRAHFKRLKARIVVIDPGRDIVMRRIEDMRQPGMKAVATKWYKAQRGQSHSAIPPRPWSW